MSQLGAVWHLLNFFAPALLVGVFSALAVKWIWRRDMRSVGWRSMLAWAVVPAALVAVAGLILTGRDGKMATYMAMVAACALGLWWRCFVRGSSRN